MTKAMVRPVFFAMLKGSSMESKIYQVLWQSDPSTLTHINLHSHNLMPPDQGTVIIVTEGQEIRIDPKRPTVTLGRGAECDIRVTDSFASRRHALVTLRRTQSSLPMSAPTARTSDGQAASSLTCSAANCCSMARARSAWVEPSTSWRVPPCDFAAAGARFQGLERAYGVAPASSIGDNLSGFCTYARFEQAGRHVSSEDR